ncbi:MAG TPA: hypothetical protein VIR16_09425 [Candidatus Limnocylindrales bacterium]
MNRGLTAAALALLIVPLVAGCSLLPGSKATPAGPTQPPPLSAGQHRSAVFQPALTFTVPDGWTNPVDDATYFELMPVLDQNSGIHLFHNWQALSQAASCPYAPEPGVGTGAQALVTWIRSLKGLSVTQPVLVSVGGLPATTIDVRITPNWTQSCSFANGLPTVPLLIDPTQKLHWVVAGNETMRLYILDILGGTLIVNLDSFDGVGFPSLLTNASPIVKSLTIAVQ